MTAADDPGPDEVSSLDVMGTTRQPFSAPMVNPAMKYRISAAHP